MIEIAHLTVATRQSLWLGGHPALRIAISDVDADGLDTYLDRRDAEALRDAIDEYLEGRIV